MFARVLRGALSARAYPIRSRITTISMASAAPVDAQRPLFARVRVKNLKEQVDYYTKHFGMKVLKEGPEKNAFLGFGSLDKNFAVEVVEDGEPIDIGEGFGHFGVALPDVYAAVAKIKEEGGKVTRDAGPVKGGQTVIAFVEDPTGYKWELLQRGATPEPLCQVMLRVGDLQRSIKWYQDTLGMQLVKQRDNPDYKYTLGFMGYGPEESNLVLELTYNYGTESYKKGNAYSYVAIQVNDVHKAAEQIKAAGGKVLQEPGPARLTGGEESLILTTEDPDGYKVMLVQPK